MFSVPNPIYDIDSSTLQNPGISVTPEEQKLADEGELEYTFQVELHTKPGVSDLTIFQLFTNRVIRDDNSTRFLPWYNNYRDTKPKITCDKSPYQVIRGEVRLRIFLGPYNKNRNRIYGRLNVRVMKAFDEIK